VTTKYMFVFDNKKLLQV